METRSVKRWAHFMLFVAFLKIVAAYSLMTFLKPVCPYTCQCGGFVFLYPYICGLVAFLWFFRAHCILRIAWHREELQLEILAQHSGVQAIGGIPIGQPTTGTEAEDAGLLSQGLDEDVEIGDGVTLKVSEFDEPPPPYQPN